MKRLIFIATLVFSSTALLAQGVNETPCWVLASGGGTAASVDNRVFGVLGQPLAGDSFSAGHRIHHGYSPCSSLPTAVGDPPSLVPASYALHQNSPNPFNPRTVIRYDVPADAGRVAIVIYDVSGRRVRALIDRIDLPGRHQATWDGTDDGRRTVASGLYIAVLETPRGRFHKKMTLLR